MKEYKFSIIIPHLNEWYYLDIMLDSFYNYINYDNYEIIIVDDWSDDLSNLDFINTHFLKEKIKLYKKKPKWLPLTKNYWAKKATWDILVFLDSHMYLKSDILNEINLIYNKHKKVDLLQLCIWNIWDKSHNWEIYKIKDKTLNPTWDYIDSDDEIVETTNIAWWCTIIRKKVFDKLTGFNKFFIKWWAEDLEFSMRAFLYWYKLYLAKKIKINHYFKTSFTNTVVKNEQVLYNKIVFALTCFTNKNRLTSILNELKKDYSSIFDKEYLSIERNIPLNNYIKRNHLKYKYDDNYYFNNFNNFYKDF